MAVNVGNNATGGSEDIEPISEAEAKHFLETHSGDDVLMRFFPDHVEEA